jgi:hypothetical protein
MPKKWNLRYGLPVALILTGAWKELKSRASMMKSRRLTHLSTIVLTAVFLVLLKGWPAQRLTVRGKLLNLLVLRVTVQLMDHKVLHIRRKHSGRYTRKTQSGSMMN